MENDGVDYEAELRKSKKIEIELRKDEDFLCVECNKVNKKSVRV